MPELRIGVVIVTMGNRARKLDALLDSVAAQSAKAARVVVLGNGTQLPGMPGWVTTAELAETWDAPAAVTRGSACCWTQETSTSSSS